MYNSLKTGPGNEGLWVLVNYLPRLEEKRNEMKTKPRTKPMSWKPALGGWYLKNQLQCVWFMALEWRSRILLSRPQLPLCLARRRQPTDRRLRTTSPSCPGDHCWTLSPASNSPMCHLCIVCSPLYSPLVSVLALLVIECIRNLTK